ncbi:MAG: carboxypeptidase-like regulatory domain-containing protein [Oscillospiraceae bacterium]|nr:carboxypeptidase-like regulatory domain-containing protein [Oscillospiraceae bacterium]
MNFFNKRIWILFLTLFSIMNINIVNVHAKSNGQILGIVKDLNTGIPLYDADICIYDDKVTHIAFTDIDGKFSLDNLKKGSYKVIIDSENYETAISKVNVKSGTITIGEFFLSKKRGDLSGFVKERDNNRPVEGALVYLTDGKTTFSQITDSSGKYALNNISIGTYGVTVSLKDYDVEGPNSLYIAPDLNMRDFSLNRLKGEIFGKAIDSNDMSGIKGVSIIVSDGKSSYEAVTDSNGDFCIKGIYGGEYEMTAVLDGYEKKLLTNISVNGGNKINKDALIEKKVSLTGRVTDAKTKAPISLALVTVSNGQEDYSQTTDSNGNYIISDLALGKYTIKISLLNYDDFGPEDILIDSDHTTKDFSIVHQTGSITGKIVNNIDKSPLASVYIVLKSGINEYKVLTDSNGIFTLENVDSGYYNMSASLEGYEIKQFTNIFIKGSGLSYQDFELIKTP